MSKDILTFGCGCKKACSQCMVARPLEAARQIRFEMAIQGSIVLTRADAVRLHKWLDKFIKGTLPDD